MREATDAMKKPAGSWWGRERVPFKLGLWRGRVQRFGSRSRSSSKCCGSASTLLLCIYGALATYPPPHPPTPPSSHPKRLPQLLHCFTDTFTVGIVVAEPYTPPRTPSTLNPLYTPLDRKPGFWSRTKKASQLSTWQSVATMYSWVRTSSEACRGRFGFRVYRGPSPMCFCLSLWFRVWGLSGDRWFRVPSDKRQARKS